MEPIFTTDRREEDVDDLTKTTKDLMDQEFTKLKKEIDLYMQFNEIKLDSLFI